LFEAWDLLADDIDDLICKFELISYKSIKRGTLNKNWERVKVLKPDTLLSAIMSGDTFRVIRRNLRNDTGVRVDDEEVYRGITRLLNEAAGKAVPSLKALQPKRKPRKKTSRGKSKATDTDATAEPPALNN